MDKFWMVLTWFLTVAIVIGFVSFLMWLSQPCLDGTAKNDPEWSEVCA